MTARRAEKRRDSYWRRELKTAFVKPQFGDGCSFSPDTLVCTIRNREGIRETRAVSLTPCCQDHDLAYHIGGDDDDRKIADREFRICLRCRIGRWKASAYYYAVRIFGAAFFQRSQRE